MKETTKKTGRDSPGDSRQGASGAFATKVTWIAADEDVFESRATIVDRGDEMVIEVPPGEETGPYLVVGKRYGHYFAGVDTYDGEAVDVVARWSLLGDTYVGLWREDGVEYLFRFSPIRRGGA